MAFRINQIMTETGVLQENPDGATAILTPDVNVAFTQKPTTELESDAESTTELESDAEPTTETSDRQGDN